MEKIEARLQELAQAVGISLSGPQLGKFQRYLELLLVWNEKVNLTAITEPQEVVIKHFLDSLLLLNTVSLKQGTKVIDVGTGAGFPGIPLKIARPDLDLTLLDSLNKRLVFLQELLKELELSAETVHCRAEEGGRKKELRGKFDFVTARAVAPLNLLCEYCLPFLKVGGIFAAMKGPNCSEEIEAAKKAIGILGAEIKEKKELNLPDGSGRTIIVLKKCKETSDRYPRISAKIAKNPL